MSLLEVRNLYVGFAMYHTFYRRRIGYGGGAEGVGVARVVGDFRGDVKQRRHARAVALGKRL